jgi:hypothetical protein
MNDQARSLLGTVARFKLGQQAAAGGESRPPAPVGTATIAPVKVKTPDTLPAAYAGVLPRAKAASGNGEWKEF